MCSLTSYGKHLCGGTLIAPDIVLTAGHCEAATGVVVGNHAKYKGGEEYPIKAKKRHEEYSIAGYKYDVMLMKIFGRSDAPIVRINGRSGVPVTGYPLTVMGWGVTSTKTRESSDYLREATVVSLSQYDCSKSYEDDKIQPYMMCAADRFQDACQGDSGGPLIVGGRSASRDVQVGIVSWGHGCADREYPGVYTRVSYVYDWIRFYSCVASDHPPDYVKCPASSDRYPYAASLGRNDERLCSAALISPDFLLSSAQCVGATAVKVGGDTFEVSRKWRHYKYRENSKKNDLLLIKIRGQSSGIVAKVNSDPFRPGNGSPLISLGVGVKDKDTGDVYDGLQRMGTTYHPTPRCVSAYGSRIGDDNLCTYDRAHDSCHTDVGGPVIVEGENAGTDRIVGVRSWSRGCADADRPDVSSRVSHNYGWIRRIVCQWSYSPDWTFNCPIDRAKHPYMVKLSKRGKHKCSGFLITSTVVLTAGQCRDIDTVEIDNTFEIVDKIVHPDYHGADNRYDFMIVVLKTKSSRMPCRLNDDGYYPLNGYPLVSVGYGMTDSITGVRYDGLQRVDRYALPNAECDGAYGGGGDIIRDDSLCSRKGSYDRCPADAGGPIMLKGPVPEDDSCVGVVSWERGCASNIYPSVNSRVSAVFPWIETTVCETLPTDGTAPVWFDCSKSKGKGGKGGADEEDERKGKGGGGDTTATPGPTPAPTDRAEGRAPGSRKITVVIQADDYPGDVRWFCSSHDGEDVYAESRDYSDEDPSARIVETFDVEPSDSYRFVITDKFGDGLMYGTTGWYKLYWGTELKKRYLILHGRGDYGESVQENFVPDGIEDRYVEFEMKFDDNPQDIGWRLDYVRSSGATQLVRRKRTGAYRNPNNVGRVITERIAIPSRTGQYKFTVTDRGGDGVCCDEGVGYYKVRVHVGSEDEYVVTFLSDDGFGRAASHRFEA